MKDEITWVIEGHLARSSRPGWWGERDLKLVIPDWIERVRQMGVRSIVCLLNDAELDRFYGRQGIHLLQHYEAAGFRVARVPVPDHEEPPMTEDELQRLCEALGKLPAPWLIHCSAGIDRTGCAVEFLHDKQGALDARSHIRQSANPMNPNF